MFLKEKLQFWSEIVQNLQVGKGEEKGHVSWGLGCKLEEMWGQSWPFSLPVCAQFMGGGAGTTHAAKLKLTQLSLHSGLAFVLWSVSLSEKSVLRAHRKFSYSQTHMGEAVLWHVPYWLRDLCATCPKGAWMSSCTAHWGFLLPEQTLGIFQGTSTGINDSYCLQQILFLWFIRHRKFGFWMWSKTAAFSWCWYQSLVSYLINPPSKLLFPFFFFF